MIFSDNVFKIPIIYNLSFFIQSINKTKIIMNCTLYLKKEIKIFYMYFRK